MADSRLQPLQTGEVVPPAEVRRVWLDLPGQQVEEVPLTEEVEHLAKAYVDGGALGEASPDDARHVAAAAVGEAEVIVSWNFQHIVNRRRIQLYNAINAIQGYRVIDIYSPREMGERHEQDL